MSRWLGISLCDFIFGIVEVLRVLNSRKLLKEEMRAKMSKVLISTPENIIIYGY